MTPTQNISSVHWNGSNPIPVAELQQSVANFRNGSYQNGSHQGGSQQNGFYQQKSFNGVIFNHSQPQNWIRPTKPIVETLPSQEPIISQHSKPAISQEPERFRKVTQPLLSQIKSVSAMQKSTTITQSLDASGEITPFGPKASLKRPKQRLNKNEH